MNLSTTEVSPHWHLFTPLNSISLPNAYHAKSVCLPWMFFFFCNLLPSLCSDAFVKLSSLPSCLSVRHKAQQVHGALPSTTMHSLNKFSTTDRYTHSLLPFVHQSVQSAGGHFVPFCEAVFESRGFLKALMYR